MKIKTTAIVGSIVLVLALPTAASGSLKSTSAASTIAHTCAKPLTIGFVAPVTGAIAASLADSVAALKARVDAQNAKGGVNGCQVKVVVADDGSSPTQAVTAAQTLIQSDDVDVLATTSFFTLLFSTAANQAGVPVVGANFDGPEWGTQPNTNMFGNMGGVAPSLPEPTTEAKLLKASGVTKLALICNDNPSAIKACQGQSLAAKSIGIDVTDDDTSVPSTSLTLTTDALAAVQSHANGVFLQMGSAQNIAGATALSQQGFKGKILLAAGYGQQVLDNPSLIKSLQGALFESFWQPVELNSPGTKTMQATLKKYAHLSGVPEFGAYEGYTTGDLAITALQAGGPHPTHKSIIAGMLKVTAWDADGISSSPINFATSFGKGAEVSGANSCLYFLKLTGSKFVPVSTKPTCGTVVK